MARMTDKPPVERVAEVQFRAYESEYSTHGMTIADFYDTARADLTAAVADREGLARVLAESMPCTWSIPQDGHPYDDGCVHRRGGQGRGACWDQAWELAAAVARWLTGEEA